MIKALKQFRWRMDNIVLLQRRWRSSIVGLLVVLLGFPVVWNGLTTYRVASGSVKNAVGVLADNIAETTLKIDKTERYGPIPSTGSDHLPIIDPACGRSDKWSISSCIDYLPGFLQRPGGLLLADTCHSRPAIFSRGYMGIPVPAERFNEQYPALLVPGFGMVAQLLEWVQPDRLSNFFVNADFSGSLVSRAGSEAVALNLQEGKNAILQTEPDSQQENKEPGVISALLLVILLLMMIAILLMYIKQRDQRKRRRDQDQLSQANAELMRKLSRALEQTDDSVMITDNNGLIEFVNNSFERVSGYSAREVMGKTPSLMRSGMHEPGFYRNMWRIINNGIAFREVMINRRKNGELYYEQKTITPLKDDDGQITHFVSTGKDISEHMEIQQRLNFLANHDVLTGLPNRALFQERLEHALTQARRHQSKLVLMFVELDNFKNINDSLGHAIGDRLLEVTGQRLSVCVRESDTVVRLGGDEFAVILESVDDINNVARVARTVLDLIAEPVELADREVVVTASIGVTVFPEDASDGENLCRNADVAVYRAKELGRNGYQFFTADLTVSASQRMMLEHGLRYALERNEFELHYQPKVTLANNHVSGVEALLRWNNSELGLVPPDVFVPVLESTGLISDVGDWILHEACRFVVQMGKFGYELGVAVNVSARQMIEPRLAQHIEYLLQEYQLSPSALELEITESMLIENIAPSIDELVRLRELGVKVSVDDFGTGYSSLGYLKRLPIDTLKIDRTFVRDLPEDSEDVAITSAIVALADSLDLQTIAEGVETEEQVGFLRDLGCDQAQGYFFSPPLQDVALLEWLEQKDNRACRCAETNCQCISVASIKDRQSVDR